MRIDMAKVIVERPRWGSDLASKKKGYRRSLQKSDVADLPRKEPLAGRWRGMQRALREHLGPMRRFLRSNLGRPWNKVHQELCENVSFNNVVQRHILAHVFEIVQRHASDFEATTVEMRTSKKNNYLSVTCTVRAASRTASRVSHGLVKPVGKR